MKIIRKLNKSLLREWIKVNGKGSLERLAVAVGCSASLIQKLLGDSYNAVPRFEIVEGLLRETGHTIDELFPVCEIGKKSA